MTSNDAYDADRMKQKRRRRRRRKRRKTRRLAEAWWFLFSLCLVFDFIIKFSDLLGQVLFLIIFMQVAKTGNLKFAAKGRACRLGGGG